MTLASQIYEFTNSRIHKTLFFRFMFATPGGLGLHLCGILPPRWSGDYIGAKKCTDCGKSYKKRYDLLAHIAKVHKKAKNFACAHCDYRAAVPFLLTKHIR